MVRRAGICRNSTFEMRPEAKDWAATIASQPPRVAATGLAPTAR